MRMVSLLTAFLMAPVAQAQNTLSVEERQAFGAEVARCWNLGALAEGAKTPVVTVAFALSRDGVPVADSLRLIGAGKDTAEAVKSAYQAARRAILRCGANGYKLPLEKYEIWRNTELTFNPERMSLR